MSSENSETLMGEVREIMRDGKARTSEEIFKACKLATAQDQVSKAIYSLKQTGHIETPKGQKAPFKHQATELLMTNPQTTQDAQAPKPAPVYTMPAPPAWAESIDQAHAAAKEALLQYLEALNDPVLHDLILSVDTLESLARRSAQ